MGTVIKLGPDIQRIEKLLREKGPFTPEEDLEFKRKLEGSDSVLSGGIPIDELMEGIMRSTALSLSEEDRTPEKVWGEFLRMYRKGQGIRRQEGEFGQGRVSGSSKER